MPRGSPLVSWSRGGGLAGIPLEMTIERGGRATLIVGIDAKQSRFRLADDELAQLIDELDAADLEDIDLLPPDAVCADCFGYEIAVEGEVPVRFDDGAEKPDSVSTVIGHLTMIAIDHAAPDTMQ